MFIIGLSLLFDDVCRFIYGLSQIPCFDDRCYCIIFQSTYAELIASIDNRLANVRMVVQVSASFCFCKVLFLYRLIFFERFGYVLCYLKLRASLFICGDVCELLDYMLLAIPSTHFVQFLSIELVTITFV